MNSTQKLALNLFLSVLLIAVILHYIGIGEILSAFRGINLLWFLCAITLYLILIIIMSERIRIVLKSMGTSLSAKSILPSNLAGLFASDFTPARVGYFFTAFSLSSRFNIPLEKTLSAIFCPQLFDFLIKAVSATILTLLIIGTIGLDGWLMHTVIIAIAFTAIIFAGLLVFTPKFLKLFSFAEHIPVISIAFHMLMNMQANSHYVLKVKWKVISITLISWAVKALEWTCLAYALNIAITGHILTDFLFMMVFQGAITIIQFMPIPTVAGIGASEATSAYILILFGVPLASGIAFAFLTRLIMILIDMFSISIILEYLKTHALDRSLEQLTVVH